MPEKYPDVLVLFQKFRIFARLIESAPLCGIRTKICDESFIPLL